MEKERLMYTIDRFDHFFDSVNSKSSVILGLSTFIVGGLIAAYPFFVEKVNITIWIHANLIAMIVLGLISMMIMIIASTPYLSSKSDSVFYFLSVSHMATDDFFTQSQELKDTDELVDLRNQVHVLSKGLKGKFQKLKAACILITIQFFLLIPLIILLLINLK